MQSRQSLTLSGLGTEGFNQAILALLKIHQFFQDNCAEGQIDTWSTRVDRGHPILTAGNRYLTAHTDDQVTHKVVSMKDIDPLEILQKAVPDEVNFLDRESVQLLIGEDQLKYERA